MGIYHRLGPIIALILSFAVCSVNGVNSQSCLFSKKLLQTSIMQAFTAQGRLSQASRRYTIFDWYQSVLSRLARFQSCNTYLHTNSTSITSAERKVSPLPRAR